MTSAVKSETIAYYAGLALLVVLALPGSRELLEARLASHMLVQLPLLALSGWLIGVATLGPVGLKFSRFNRRGLSGIVLFACLALIWMIPRLLEMSLVDPTIALSKFVTLALAGLALAWSYPIAPPVFRGVLFAQAVSMLAAFGWAYIAAPTRLCTAYLADDQFLTGALLLAGSLALAAGIAVGTLLDKPRNKIASFAQPGPAA